MNMTRLYCIKGETEKFKQSLEWYKENVKEYTIWEGHNIEYHHSVRDIQYECYVYAKILGHFEIMELLSKYDDINKAKETHLRMIMTDDDNIQPIILYSMKNNLPALINCILQYDINKNEKPFYIRCYFLEALSIACYCEYYDIAEYIISEIKKLDKGYIRDNYELTQLRDNDINCGNDINPYDPTLLTDYTIAIDNNNVKVLKMLVDNFLEPDDMIKRWLVGCSGETFNMNEKIVAIATYACKVDCVDILVTIFKRIKEYSNSNQHQSKDKTDIMERCLFNMSNSFHTACVNKSYKCIKFMAPYYRNYNAVNGIKKKSYDIPWIIREDYHKSVWFLLVKYINIRNEDLPSGLFKKFDYLI